VRDKYGCLPLHYLASGKRTTEKLVKLVLNAYPGGALDTDTTTGMLPLHSLVHTRRPKNKEWLKAIEAILQAFPDAVSEPVVGPTGNFHSLGAQMFAGMYSLHLECAKKKPWSMLVTKLLDYFPGAAGVPGGSRGCLPLHLALVGGGRVDQKLLTQLVQVYPSATLEFDEAAGRLPLHYACMSPRSSIEVFNMLVKAYPESVGVSDELSGRLPIHWACKNPNAKLAVQIAKKLVVNSECLRVQDTVGMLPIHYAAKHKKGTELVKLILAADKDSALVGDKSEGLIAIEFACMGRAINEDMIRELIIAHPNRGFLGANAARRTGNMENYFQIKGIVEQIVPKFGNKK
jgi:ankyrin repeat protein